MKIGFDAKRIFHNFRGLGNYSRTLVESLVKHFPENEYVLFTPPFDDSRASEWKRRFSNLEIVTPKSGLGRAFSSSWRSLFLARVIKNQKIDIYHGLSHELPPGLKNSKTKTVVTVHDLIFLRFPDYFPWIDRQVYLRKFKHAIESADIVVAICDQTKNDLMHFLQCPEEKIRIVYQSCHPNFYAGLSADRKQEIREKFNLPEHFILYVGAIEERKNALSLVQAFARLKDLIPHNLILVGDGKEYKKLVEKEIIHQGLLERVSIHSNISSEDLPGFYQMADLFVYPSFFEGWGIPNVEALFSGVPVITSEGSCFPESAGPTSVYCNPYEIEDLVSKMEKVLFDDDLRAIMIRQGREYAEQFHWKNTSQKMMEVYKELMP
jgi:glycosyltransferase involved in cell wall biosynthesis